MAAEPNFVFVYGTLKRGGRLHRNMELIRAEFVADAHIKAVLYNLGWYPGIKATKAVGDCVYGEIFLVREWAGIERLDAVEGHPNLFERRLVEAWTGAKPLLHKFDPKVWAYFFQHDVQPQHQVAGGVWQVNEARA